MVAPALGMSVLHAVLKWVHQVDWWKVMLKHWVDASHNSEHSARLSTKPGEFGKRPAVAGLHDWPDKEIMEVSVGMASAKSAMANILNQSDSFIERQA